MRGKVRGLADPGDETHPRERVEQGIVPIADDLAAADATQPSGTASCDGNPTGCARVGMISYAAPNAARALAIGRNSVSGMSAKATKPWCR